MENAKSDARASDEYRPSRKSFIANYSLAAVVLIILFMFSITIDMKDPALFMVLMFMMVFLSMLVAEPEKTIQENSYAITENEVIHTSGIFSKKQTIIPFSKIESIKVEQGVLGRMLNFGDISVSGAKDSITMKGLENINEIHQKISDRVNLKAK